VCGSCGAPNPRRLSGPEWAELVAAYQDDRGMASRALARAIGARRAEQRVAARKIRDILQEIDEQRTR
jgi:cytochrome c551/c552